MEKELRGRGAGGLGEANRVRKGGLERKIKNRKKTRIPCGKIL